MTKKKPNGYWEKEENVVVEARRVMSKEEWGVLPSASELAKHGYHSLCYAISKHHGFINFRTKLGQQSPRKPHRYWQSLDNSIKEAQQAMQEQEWTSLPSQKNLRKYGYLSLDHAISTYHGGIQQFRTTLGQTNNKKPQGYWQSLDNSIKEAQQAMQQHNWKTLPSVRELNNHGCVALSVAIDKYYKGIRAFRTTLGQQNLEKPKGYWQKQENAIGEALKAMEEHGWVSLPPQYKLQGHVSQSLINAINRYYGGIINFRKLLTEHITGKTQKQQLEELLDEYIAA